MGANPTRQPLQPEATGAVMEETKWLKPSVSVSRIGDSASVQADPVNLPGKADTDGRMRARSPPVCCTGVVAAARTQGKRTQHGKPLGVVGDDQLVAGDGQTRRPGVAERFVLPLKLGNAGGGKGPQFETGVESSEGREIGQPSNSG